MLQHITKKHASRNFTRSYVLTKIVLFLIIVCCCNFNKVDSISPTSPQPYVNWMKENVGKYDYDTYINDKFALHWKIQDDKIYLAVAAEVSGWVAFGISEAGGMPGSDIILFEAAKNTLTDHHAVKYAKPILDNCQDWTLSNSVIYSSAPFILFEAMRALDTGDDQDRVIGDDSYIGSALHKLIFAWGNEPSMVFHGSNRLAANIRFYKSNITSDDASDVKTLDLKVPNYTIPERETTYKTFSFQVSDLQAQGFPANGVAHLIGSRFIPHPETEELVHHILVYGKFVTSL